MNIIDLLIIIFVIYSVFMGYTRGLIKEGFNIVGNFLVLVLAFTFTKSLSEILCNSLPLYDFGFFGVHLSFISILIYHIIAFLLIFLILRLFLSFILAFTGVVDTVIDLVPVFNKASKIGGMIVGLFSGMLLAFVVLVVLSVPMSGNTLMHESRFTNYILDRTFILSNMSKSIRDATLDIYTLSDTINKDQERLAHTDKYNSEVLDILLKYDIVKKETVDNLIKNGKVDKTDDIEYVLEYYERENK